MKRTTISLFVLTLMLLSIAAALPNIVTAQTGYSIDQVDHTIGILSSGNVVILDTIHLSGAVPDRFLVALPYRYSADVLKVLAYDSSRLYDVNVGVQLPNYSGFYGVSVNLDGAAPTEFTVAFVLSNSLTVDQNNGSYLVNYPAYPSFTQIAKDVNVNIICPTTPTAIIIGKDDGNITTTHYSANNLPAYTYAVAEANLQFPPATIQKATIQSLNRDITITSTGTVQATDTIQISNNASAPFTAYIVSLPAESTNIEVKDQTGTSLTINTAENSGMQLVNATFPAALNIGETATLTARYNLPAATLKDAQYTLLGFQFFSRYQYVIQDATITFNLPEGATITSPKASTVGTLSVLTRNAYKDSLTVSANHLSYVDFLAPQVDTVFSYAYNPVWVSFGATFYASLAAVLVVVGGVVYRWKWPKQTYRTLQKPATRTSTVTSEKPVYKTVKGAQITPEVIHAFTGAYEDKKHLLAELHALDLKAGKMARRQYKAQRAALETRMDSITGIIERNKALFRGASGAYRDLIEQFDVAEADLTYAQETLGALEVRQSNGEISLEAYKKAIVDAQKTRDKAELVINGILLRLREKIR